MRERLLKLIKEAVDICSKTKRCDGCICFAKGKGAECINYLIADHILADGIIAPPCKVGDVVYLIYETYDEEGINSCVLDCEVEQLGIDSKSTWFQLKLPLGVKLSGYFRNNTLGKNVFLTREEAEAALKEKESNGRK